MITETLNVQILEVRKPISSYEKRRVSYSIWPSDRILWTPNEQTFSFMASYKPRNSGVMSHTMGEPKGI